MDKQWNFEREWEKLKKKVDYLERKVYWLEKWKGEMKEKELQQYYKNKDA